jgi:cytochrome c5
VAVSDRHFLDTFMLVVGILVGATVGIVFLANSISARVKDDRGDAVLAEQLVLQRIEPVGQVALVGDVNASMSAPVMAKPEPVAEILTGPQVYNAACQACHAAGVGGAPVRGVADQWAPRIAQGRDTLENHVINGYQGQAGYMPPKGGRIDLSDGEILAALDFMLEAVQ